MNTMSLSIHDVVSARVLKPVTFQMNSSYAESLGRLAQHISVTCVDGSSLTITLFMKDMTTRVEVE